MIRYDGRKRVVIENVQPSVDGGRVPVKRIAGDVIEVGADIMAEAHEMLDADVLYKKRGMSDWLSAPMTGVGNDGWKGAFKVSEQGVYIYTVRAWVDHFGTWIERTGRKLSSGQDIAVDLKLGAELIEQTAARASQPHNELLHDTGRLIASERNHQKAFKIASDREISALMRCYADRTGVTEFDPALMVIVERTEALFGAWYEFFPRSCADNGEHGRFTDCEKRLSQIADMGFDIVYLPPIHPVGFTNRKGKENAPAAFDGDPGSPWAIGSRYGGHVSVEPALGTQEEFDHFVKKAASLGLQTALDLAFQCSPDHPYIREHPEWFFHRPDGSIQYAENPPKKYQDIVPFNFDTPRWKELWDELKAVVLFWIRKGITIFRVDNPHTKPFPFWEWLITEIKRDYPEVLFLSEAFTRPKIMYYLAKCGFSQSYTYFTWRNSGKEIREYFQELVSLPVAEFFRPNLWPNTPDILPDYLQLGDERAFAVRFVLAATLSSSYGIYGPAFELAINEALPGREEYLHSEKYEIRNWGKKNGKKLTQLITNVNRIRRDNPALHMTRNLKFLETDNDSFLMYYKANPDESDIIIVLVNLDPYHCQTGQVILPLDDLGVRNQPFLLLDLLTDEHFLLQSGRYTLSLDPAIGPAFIFRLVRRKHMEVDYEYY